MDDVLSFAPEASRHGHGSSGGDAGCGSHRRLLVDVAERAELLEDRGVHLVVNGQRERSERVLSLSLLVEARQEDLAETLRDFVSVWLESTPPRRSTPLAWRRNISEPGSSLRPMRVGTTSATDIKRSMRAGGAMLGIRMMSGACSSSLHTLPCVASAC